MSTERDHTRRVGRSWHCPPGAQLALRESQLRPNGVLKLLKMNNRRNPQRRHRAVVPWLRCVVRFGICLRITFLSTGKKASLFFD